MTTDLLPATERSHWAGLLTPSPRLSPPAQLPGSPQVCYQGWSLHPRMVWRPESAPTPGATRTYYQVSTPHYRLQSCAAGLTCLPRLHVAMVTASGPGGWFRSVWRRGPGRSEAGVSGTPGHGGRPAVLECCYRNQGPHGPKWTRHNEGGSMIISDLRVSCLFLKRVALTGILKQTHPWSANHRGLIMPHQEQHYGWTS